MKLSLERINSDEWKKFSESAHMIAFREVRTNDHDRIDYALIVRNEKDICAYATLIEIDKKTVYMQHGGAMPNVEKSVNVIKCYFMIMNWLKEQYNYISTKVLNLNAPMIKLAMSAGLVITGVECVNNLIFLNFMWCKS